MQPLRVEIPTDRTAPFQPPEWAAIPPSETSYKFKVTKDGELVEETDLTKRVMWVIGCSEELAHIFLYHNSISRQHAALCYHSETDSYYLIDLKSYSGSYVDEVQLKPYTPIQVWPGSKIQFGESSREFSISISPVVQPLPDEAWSFPQPVLSNPLPQQPKNQDPAPQPLPQSPAPPAEKENQAAKPPEDQPKPPPEPLPSPGFFSYFWRQPEPEASAKAEANNQNIKQVIPEPPAPQAGYFSYFWGKAESPAIPPDPKPAPPPPPNPEVKKELQVKEAPPVEIPASLVRRVAKPIAVHVQEEPRVPVKQPEPAQLPPLQVPAAPLPDWISMSPLEYGIAVAVLAIGLSFWVLYQNWELLIGASVVTFWASILGVMLVVFPIYSRKLDKYSNTVAFLLGYIAMYFDFSLLWLIPFSFGILFAPMQPRVSASPRGPLDSHEISLKPNKWINIVLQKILTQLTNLDFPNFDIGVTIPSFKCLHMSDDISRPNGFDMIMAYDYETQEDTHLTLRLPITVPAYGEVKVPISVSGPSIKGKIRFDGRFETCTYQFTETTSETSEQIITKSDKFFALGIAFEKIEKITVGSLRVMNAPKLEWFLTFDRVKTLINSAIDAGLSTDEVIVHLFDSSLEFLGSKRFPRKRQMLPSKAPAKTDSDGHCADDGWTVQDLVKELKQCYRCQRFSLDDFIGCCCERPSNFKNQAANDPPGSPVPHQTVFTKHVPPQEAPKPILKKMPSKTDPFPRRPEAEDAIPPFPPLPAFQEKRQPDLPIPPKLVPIPKAKNEKEVSPIFQFKETHVPPAASLNNPKQPEVFREKISENEAPFKAPPKIDPVKPPLEVQHPPEKPHPINHPLPSFSHVPPEKPANLEPTFSIFSLPKEQSSQPTREAASKPLFDPHLLPSKQDVPPSIPNTLAPAHKPKELPSTNLSKENSNEPIAIPPKSLVHELKPSISPKPYGEPNPPLSLMPSVFYDKPNPQPVSIFAQEIPSQAPPAALVEPQEQEKPLAPIGLSPKPFNVPPAEKSHFPEPQIAPSPLFSSKPASAPQMPQGLRLRNSSLQSSLSTSIPASTEPQPAISVLSNSSQQPAPDKLAESVKAPIPRGLRPRTAPQTSQQNPPPAIQQSQRPAPDILKPIQDPLPAAQQNQQPGPQKSTVPAAQVPQQKDDYDYPELGNLSF